MTLKRVEGDAVRCAASQKPHGLSIHEVNLLENQQNGILRHISANGLLEKAKESKSSADISSEGTGLAQ